MLITLLVHVVNTSYSASSYVLISNSSKQLVESTITVSELNQLLSNIFYPNVIIQKTNGDTVNQLTISPGYKGATPTTTFIAYDIPGSGTHFFQDSVEVNSNLIVDTFNGSSNYLLTSNSSKQIVENTYMSLSGAKLNIINNQDGGPAGLEIGSTTQYINSYIDFETPRRTDYGFRLIHGLGNSS